MTCDGNNDTRSSPLDKLALGFVTMALITGVCSMSAEGQADSPPLGLYKCYTMSGPSGEFTLLEGGKYAVGNQVGDYRYVPATRSIEWIGGYWGGQPSPEYMGLNSSGYTLKLPWKTGKSQLTLYCHRRP
jgi:hypothetical protein